METMGESSLDILIVMIVDRKMKARHKWLTALCKCTVLTYGKRRERATCQWLHHCTLSGGRSVEPFSTGPRSRVWSEPHSRFPSFSLPSHSSFFLSLHYYLVAVSSQGFAVLKFRRDRGQFSKSEYPLSHSCIFEKRTRVFPPLRFRGNEMSEDLLISILTATINRMRDTVRIRTTVILQQLHLAVIYVSI